MSFLIKSLKIDGKVYCLTDSDISDKNIFTVVIGKNSIGKSRVLGAIVSTFEAIERNGRVQRIRSGYGGKQDSLLSNFSIDYVRDVSYRTAEVNNGEVKFDCCDNYYPAIEQAQPSAVIAISTAQFDRFPIGHLRSSKDVSDSSKYTYIGPKNKFGYSSGIWIIEAIIRSIFSKKCISEEFSSLKKVFKFLGFKPRLDIECSFETSLKRLIDAYEMNGKDGLDYLKRNPRLTQVVSQIKSENIVSFSEFIESVYELQWFTNNQQRIQFNVDFDGYSKIEKKFISCLQVLISVGIARISDVTLLNDSVFSEQFSLRSASSGQLNVMLIVFGIASRIENDSLICIDEPENSLHPEWQERFISLVNEIFNSYTGCHFVIATHSPQIIAQIPPNNYVLQMETHTLHESAVLYNKSIDFQLASVFNSPGNANEYLLRESIRLISEISENGELTIDDIRVARQICILSDTISKNDPVSNLLMALKCYLG